MRAYAVARKSIACRLVLVGDGVEKDNLIRLAHDLGIAEDVIFTGFQANPHKFVARSSVFAFPSLFEAQGLVMVEAMAVGCPVWDSGSLRQCAGAGKSHSEALGRSSIEGTILADRQRTGGAVQCAGHGGEVLEYNTNCS